MSITNAFAKNKNRIKDHNYALNFFTYLVMVIVVLACVIPFLYIIAMSFSSSSAITNNRVSLWPVDFNIEAYKTIYEYPNFFRAYGYTFLYTFCGTGWCCLPIR